MEQTKQEQAVTAALVVPDAAKTALQRFWKENSKQIAAVTAGTDTERIMRVTYSVLYRTPKLVECSPFSLLNGIVLAHQLGLVFGTSEVSLVPFGREATLIIGYTGKVKLALASKLVRSIHADVILEGEKFEFEVTAAGVHFCHRPIWKDRPKPTEDNVVAAYCQLTTSEGGVQTRIVSLNEILDARHRSRGYQYQVKKGGSDNPWMSDFGAMALKTAVHRAMKLAPQDARLGLAAAVDDEEEGASAVIAEGLNPAEFTERDLGAPLVETGKDAAQAVAQKKIAEMKQQRGQKAAEHLAETVMPEYTRDTLPDAFDVPVGSRCKFEDGRLLECVQEPGEAPKWKGVVDAGKRAGEKFWENKGA